MTKPDNDVIEAKVIQPGHPDYVYDEQDLKLIEMGMAPKGGSHVPPATTRLYTALTAQSRAAQKLKKVEGYSEALAEIMPYVADIKGSMLSIADEAPVDKATGKRDWSQVESSRLAVLLKAIESFENRFLGKATTKIEHGGKIDLVHQMAQIQREIEG